jgi:hypothetical protein
MASTYRPVYWVSVEEASELTGRSISSFYKLMEAGALVEGTHWKSSEDGRRLCNLEELDNWVANSTSKGSGRGRRREDGTTT